MRGNMQFARNSWRSAVAEAGTFYQDGLQFVHVGLEPVLIKMANLWALCHLLLRLHGGGT